MSCKIIERLQSKRICRNFFLRQLGFALAAISISGNASAAPPAQSQDIVALAKSGDFDALERRLTMLQKAFEADGEYERPINRAFRAFATSDPLLKERVDQWVERMPSSYAALTARGLIYRHLGWISKGGWFRRQVHPKSLAVMWQFFAAAKRDLKSALRINKRVVIAYAALIEMEAEAAERGELMRVYRAGIAALPRSSSLHIALLTSLDRRRGGSDETMDAFFELAERSAADNPGYRAVVVSRDFYMAERAFLNKQITAALAFNDSALRVKDTMPVREQRSRILLSLNHEEEAVSELRRGIELDPGDARIKFILGLLLFDRQRHQEALDLFDQALAIDPYQPEWLAMRADTLLKLNRLDEAERDLEDALVFGSHHSNVQGKRGYFFMMIRNDMRRGAEAYRHARDLAPHWQPFWQMYSRALFRLDDCEYLPASAHLMEMCVKNGLCGEGNVRYIAALNEQFKRRNRCRADVAVAPLLSLFRAASDVRGMAVAGLGLNASLDAVLQRFPDMKVVPRQLPEDPAVVYYRDGQHTSEDKTFGVRAVLSRNQRLIMLDTARVFALEESLPQIRDRLILQYGLPDQVFEGAWLELRYRQKDEEGQLLATLQISVGVVRSQAEICRLPPHLRDGRTIARMHVRLHDVARMSENTKEALANVRDNLADAAKRRSQEQRKAFRDWQAPQAAGNC